VEDEFLIYINGKYYPKSEAKISVYDHGLLYGDGVFEGIRAYSGVIFKLQEHIDRLYNSARTIMLKIPLTKSEMIQAIFETLEKNKLRDAYIRPIVTRGVGDLGLDPRKCGKPSVIIITQPMKPLLGTEAKEKGLTTLIAWVKRDPVDATSHEIKSLNYLNSILAKLEANNGGVDEAICLDKAGFVCEGVAENLFIVKDGQIFTPPAATGALPGITRNRVMALAEQLKYPMTERNITPNELFNADEVFLTGTAAEIVPVVEVNKRLIDNGRPGSITKQLMQEFNKIVRDPKEGTVIP
jgi:branched-chain amino acid aminotransferase